MNKQIEAKQFDSAAESFYLLSLFGMYSLGERCPFLIMWLAKNRKTLLEFDGATLLGSLLRNSSPLTVEFALRAAQMFVQDGGIILFVLISTYSFVLRRECYSNH